MAGANAVVDVARARWWLTNLARPDRLADAHMSALLRAHGRTVEGSPLEVGRAGARLLTEAIESLAATGLPYRVLVTCFVDGIKNRRAAARLGLSERQLSRERTRAIALLTAQLTPAQARVSCGSPPPLPDPLLARPDLTRFLDERLRSHRRVRVTGPPGCGKTTLVAAYAAASPARAFWYRRGPLAGGELPALLFELGEHLAPDDPSLAAYVRGALPAVDVALATRIALAGLARRPRLLVLDGAGAIDPGTGTFLDEVVARVPGVSVVEIGGATCARPCVSVPPFHVEETRALLRLATAHADDDVATRLHAWTGGNPSLVTPAAAWLAGGGGRPQLEDALRRRHAVITAVRGMTGAARRAAPLSLTA